MTLLPFLQKIKNMLIAKLSFIFGGQYFLDFLVLTLSHNILVHLQKVSLPRDIDLMIIQSDIKLPLLVLLRMHNWSQWVRLLERLQKNWCQKSNWQIKVENRIEILEDSLLFFCIFYRVFIDLSYIHISFI